MTTSAVIFKDTEYDRIAMVERRRWKVSLSNGKRRYTTTRWQAIEFCEEFGLPYIIDRRLDA